MTDNTDINILIEQLKEAIAPVESGYAATWDTERDECGDLLVGERKEDHFDGFILVNISDYSGDISHDGDLANFIKLCTPTNIKDLTNALEAAQKRIAELESKQLSVNVDNDMALAFHYATTDGSIGDSDIEEIKTGLQAALCNVKMTVPDGCA